MRADKLHADEIEISNAVVRTAVAVDDATWARGRGWALSVGLIALPYYLHTSPAMVRFVRHTMAAVLGDFQRAS